MPTTDAEVITALCRVVQKDCGCFGDATLPPEVSSGSIPSYAYAIRVLARIGKVILVQDEGDLVIGRWIDGRTH